jgi:outer membrane protein TolC
LLRGFGEDVVLEPLTQAERDVVYEARAYERFMHTFAVDVAERFFRVLELRDRLANEEQNHASLTRLRERNEAFAEAGRLEDIQLDQARQDELGAQDQVIAARRDLAGALDEFKFFLGLPVETEVTLEEAGQRSLDTWSELELEIDEESAVALALERRLDYRTAVDRVADAERKVDVAADALRAGLDFRSTLVATSDADEPVSFDGEDFDWTVGLEFDAPLDRLPERNVYRTARIDREVRRREEQEAADRIRADLRDSLRSLETARESYLIQSGSVELARRRVESAELNLEAGRASTRDVLEAQEDLLTAQNDAAAALTDYILAGLFLYRDMELLSIGPEGVEIDVDALGAREGTERT